MVFFKSLNDFSRLFVGHSKHECCACLGCLLFINNNLKQSSVARYSRHLQVNLQCKLDCHFTKYPILLSRTGVTLLLLILWYEKENQLLKDPIQPNDKKKIMTVVESSFDTVMIKTKAWFIDFSIMKKKNDFLATY